VSNVAEIPAAYIAADIAIFFMFCLFVCLFVCLYKNKIKLSVIDQSHLEIRRKGLHYRVPT